MIKPKQSSTAVLLALVAALLYALSPPLSRQLLGQVAPALLAGLLYLGAGIGMLPIYAVNRWRKKQTAPPLDKKDLPAVIGMVVLDIAAPILYLYGLKTTGAAAASLLGNFEIVATALIALLLFGEKICKKLWAGIGFVTAASLLVTLSQGEGSLTDHLYLRPGSLFILAACLCWGLENNCTRVLSAKDPMQIVAVKGLFSGTGSLVVAFCVAQRAPFVQLFQHPQWIFPALLLGFVAYGLSIFCYVSAQRRLGAARTGAYYAAAPFLGVGLSVVMERTLPGVLFWPALMLMAVGAWLSLPETEQAEKTALQKNEGCNSAPASKS